MSICTRTQQAVVKIIPEIPEVKVGIMVIEVEAESVRTEPQEAEVVITTQEAEVKAMEAGVSVQTTEENKKIADIEVNMETREADC